MKSIILSIAFCFVACFASAQANQVDSSAAAAAIIDISGKLKVYPNPSSNWLFVTHPSVSKKGVQLTITDINGKLVMKTDIKPQTVQTILNISQLQAGVYFVSWNNGNETGTLRLRKN
ncbi:T9SS type A sorting domain-containing protein [Lacibacter sp. MH-610]|uniref:T9SS type A sorting domain-containing protein n=1 Tax=Lacibacter sp. MH-610 TaxID=3020883 RepID=UPI003891BBC2